MEVENLNPNLSSLYEVIKRKKEVETDLLWDIVSLFMFEKMRSNDLVNLYRIFGVENFVKLIHVLGDKTIKFPSKKEIEENVLAAVVYIDREVFGMTWEEVKKKHSTLNISSIRYAIKIKSLNEFVKQQIDQVCRREKSAKASKR